MLLLEWQLLFQGEAGKRAVTALLCTAGKAGLDAQGLYQTLVCLLESRWGFPCEMAISVGLVLSSNSPVQNRA